MADTDEAPSFLQDTLAETVHREHTEHIDNLGNKHTHARFHQRRSHLHDGAHVHERQDDAQPSTPQPTVTAVVHTVSVVRQVAVDGEGNTISESAATYTANAAGKGADTAGATEAPASPAPTGEGTPDGTPGGTGDGTGAAPSDSAPSAPAAPSESATSVPTPTESAVVTPPLPESTQSTEPTPTDTPTPTDIPSSTVEPAPTDIPSSTIEPVPTDIPTSTAEPVPPPPPITSFPETTAAPAPTDLPFSSLTPVNGTAAAKGSNHAVPAFASLHNNNNTASTHAMSGGASTSARHKNGGGRYYTSVYTNAYGDVVSTTILMSADATVTEDSFGVATSLIALGTGIASGEDASGGASNNDSENPAPTPVVVGSVVGSLAGVTLIAFLVMLLLRWKRRQHGGVQLGNGRDLTSPDLPSGGAAAGPMSMIRRASTFTVPAALAALTGQNRKSQATHSSAADSQRSFVRVSGRKLPSVLTSGGNGYEDPFSDGPQDPFADPHLSNTSFYRDSRGFYGGTGHPKSPTSAGFPPSPL
ncbi:hypothetical protein O988_05107, partial [Pseudogymnoascus sp. VKM F-3808]